MLRHIVMVKFNDFNPLEEIKQELKEKLDRLIGEVDSLMKMDVGLNISTRNSAFDLVLTADFDSEEGLNAYRNHPKHVEILERLKQVAQKTAVVDYVV